MKEARFNIGIGIFEESHVKKFQEMLHNAALNGYAEDDEFEVFVSERSIGIAIVFDETQPQDSIEAGKILGYVHRCYEESELVGGGLGTWVSIHSLDGEVESTPI